MGEEDPETAVPPPKKALIVITSTSAYPDGSPTGFWLSEVVHPYNKFVSAGWEVDFASIGGTTTADPAGVDAAKDDTAVMAFWEDEACKALVEAAKPIAEVALDTCSVDYEAVYYAGGYGTMWDFPDSAESQALIKTMWEAGKIVAAVCHGPIALLNAKLSDDSLLIAGKSYTAFTNAEENAMGKYDVVATTPGTCQEAMTAVGGIFKPAGPWASNVVIDGNLFTGQNPQSAGDLAQAIIYRFDELAAEFEPPEVKLTAERAEVAGEIAAQGAAFTEALAGLKKKEKAGTNVASDLEALQLKNVAARDFRADRLAALDGKLERLAIAKQMKVDALAKAAKAAEE